MLVGFVLPCLGREIHPHTEEPSLASRTYDSIRAIDICEAATGERRAAQQRRIGRERGAAKGTA
jgi:hypothetical protein